MHGEVAGDGDFKSANEEDDEVEFVEIYVLREVPRPFITDEIYRNHKHPDSAPLRCGIDGPLHRLMRGCLRS